jgi:hypothetical protein
MKNETPPGDNFADEIVQRIDEITSRPRYAPERDRILDRIIKQLDAIRRKVPRNKLRQRH